MTNADFQLSKYPKTVKGALVTLDTSLNNVTSTIVFQYNPDTLTRSLQVQSADGEDNSRLEPLRLSWPPVETITLEAEFDTTGPLPKGKEKTAAELGVYPQLAALETLVYPTSAHVKETMRQAADGTVEILPFDAPMTLFIWGKERLLPVRLTEFSITEEAYDVNLNPVRAKVSLGLHVLSYKDLPEAMSRKLFLPHHERKERFSQLGRGRDLGELGIEGISGTSLGGFS
ncbi:MAG: hypothetical protein F6J97_22780 [Leptolyngbya sp. SIO4C1]|nr:hypothetical protein [Leptolyngbya sp. SIO4C1]